MHQDNSPQQNLSNSAPELYNAEGTLSSKIIEHMTSSNYALHHYACDFVFLICDEQSLSISSLDLSSISSLDL